MLNEDNNNPATQDSHNNLKTAYVSLQEHLSDRYTNGMQIKNERIKGLEYFKEADKILSTKFKLMSIEVHSEIDAYQLFESMNDKGADLLKSDLIKNYILEYLLKEKNKVLKKHGKIY